MSKIKVNELEAKSENTNIKLTPVGTGNVTVKGAGGNDGTLEFKTLTGNNGVKLKSPPHSAGQSYTLNLPDTNIEADKFLRVKNKTGSGNTASGTLECATLAPSDLTQLNASNLTSGTLASSVLPNSINATSGAGLKLISHTSISNSANSVYTIDLNNFLNGRFYRLLIKQLRFSQPTSYMKLKFFQSDNVNTGQYISYQAMGYSYASWQIYGGTDTMNIYTGSNFQSRKNFTAVFDFGTKAGTAFGSFQAMLNGAQEDSSYGYFCPSGGYGSNPRLYGFRFFSGTNPSDYITDADILLYEYQEV